VTAGDYNRVAAWVKANGLTVAAKTPNRRLLAVEGSVATINRAFHVKVNYYRRPGEARTFYHPIREPTVIGLSVPLLQITGMNNYVLPQSMLRHSAVASVTESAGGNRFRTGGEYLPSDMRAAYYGNGRSPARAKPSASSRLTDISQATCSFTTRRRACLRQYRSRM